MISDAYIRDEEEFSVARERVNICVIFKWDFTHMVGFHVSAGDRHLDV